MRQSGSLEKSNAAIQASLRRDFPEPLRFSEDQGIQE
jgi:hypothetical protein